MQKTWFSDFVWCCRQFGCFTAFLLLLIRSDALLLLVYDILLCSAFAVLRNVKALTSQCCQPTGNVLKQCILWDCVQRIRIHLLTVIIVKDI